MAKKYSRDEIIKHAKALGMDVPSNAATMSEGAYKDFTNSLNTFKAEEKYKEAPAKTKAKEYRATDEGKNYVAKAKEAVSRASDEDKASGNISIMDVPASVRAKIDTEIPVTTKFNYTEGLLSDIREASPFVTGARSGGKMDYTGGTQSAKEYQDYVMRYPDLKRAWNEILTNPNSETARYWLPRMGVTDPSDIKIERFGMAHQAENARLGSDTYIGDTDVRPGGSRWDEWLEGKDPATGQRDPTSDYWKDSILDPDDPNAGGITIIGGTKGIPGTTGPLGTTGLVNYAPGNEFLTTPYTRPALQDWSAIMPEEGLLRSQAQRAIVADQGANFQPWAQGGLIEYSPAGTATYVPRTYTPLGSTGTTGTTSAETATTTTVPQVYTLRDGTKTTDFMKFTQDNAERYYPGRFQAAQDAGVSGWRAFTPEGREWTAAQPNTSAAWIAAQRAANDAGTRQVASNAVFNAGRGLLNPTPAGTDLATLIALEGGWHPGVK